MLQNPGRGERLRVLVLPPLSGLVIPTFLPRLTPWATFFRTYGAGFHFGLNLKTGVGIATKRRRRHKGLLDDAKETFYQTLHRVSDCYISPRPVSPSCFVPLVPFCGCSNRSFWMGVWQSTQSYGRWSRKNFARVSGDCVTTIWLPLVCGSAGVIVQLPAVARFVVE